MQEKRSCHNEKSADGKQEYIHVHTSECLEQL